MKKAKPIETCEDCGVPLPAKEVDHLRECPERQVTLKCLCCGAEAIYDITSPEANGVFNPFCDGECEDLFAARY